MLSYTEEPFDYTVFLGGAVGGCVAVGKFRLDRTYSAESSCSNR